MDLADLIDFVRRYEWVVGEKPHSRYVRMAYDDRGQTVTITIYKRGSRLVVSEKLHLSEVYYAQLGWRSTLASRLKKMRTKSLMEQPQVILLPRFLTLSF
jgi:YD repeat-containing protein